MNAEPYGRHLPLFPTLYHRLDYPLTEDRIEREIERLCDRADAAFMAGRATQEQYDLWNIALNRWSRQMYQFAQITAASLDVRLEPVTGWTAPTPWPATSRDDEGFTYVRQEAV